MPPEDCGGSPGYYNLLEILTDPENPEHAETKEWGGGDYDPEFFSVEECNRQIKNYYSFDQT